ncbi:permease [Pseudobacteroides cellulosolvens]|uniref:CobW/HypB/UreG nucleotide-binding domain-containing protein n=1 Tax=Pseudobacteroides cellulosolvens ATCC 35603 = DSM 2933 TaxID=398512 RepID=A0A0L6JI00_9FIRM|nr:permease [Pseudobacteroides cellulosolvens]KNY25354.1 Protein of unknown function DUF318, transmembrane [Pseudobacteroides cellulosolvens ATCC 35603 = DSM 2933]
MKTQIDIYTGFLSSGKTSLIKQVVAGKLKSKERILLILSEAGEEEICEDSYPYGNVYIKRILRDEVLEAAVVSEVYKKYLPNRIIIEQNGMSSLNELLDELEKKEVRRLCEIGNIINVVDCRMFDMLMSITGATLIEQVTNSDIVVLNYVSKVYEDRVNNLLRTIKTLNKSAEILKIDLPDDYGKYLEDTGIKNSEESFMKKAYNMVLPILFIIIAAYFLKTVLIVSEIDIISMDMSWLQGFNTIFISILMQAFPFLLIGVLVSSVIQVFVSRDMIVKYFPKSKASSFIAAIIGGLFFPVCDCAIVPVASRLVKKGVPIYTAVTFMLAAPIVNPIVIASTLYAFPGQPMLVVYRLFLGITIAVASGFMFLFFPDDEKKLMTGYESLMCNCIYCNTAASTDGIVNKISSVFKHAGEEFFDVGRFLITGALLTTIFQTAIPKDLLLEVSNSGIVSLVLMMAAAVILSVCSSSDAFIARSFANHFSMGSIMGFLVLGPMVDIKNILIMLGSFNRRFVMKFILIVCTLAFAILMLFASFYV